MEERIPIFRSIEYYSDYNWSMEDVYEIAEKHIKQLQQELDNLQRSCDFFQEQMNDAVESEREKGKELDKYKAKDVELREHIIAFVQEDNYFEKSTLDKGLVKNILDILDRKE